MCDYSAVLLCVWSYKNEGSNKGIFVVLVDIYIIYMYMAMILMFSSSRYSDEKLLAHRLQQVKCLQDLCSTCGVMADAIVTHMYLSE